MNPFNSRSNQQVSSVCNAESVEENKAGVEQPTLRPDYEIIVQRWDKHPTFRESSYGLLLEVQASVPYSQFRWYNILNYQERLFTVLN